MPEDSELVYEPSLYHKENFTIAGPPRHRPGASKCPPELCTVDAQSMLLTGLMNGYVSEQLENGIPKHVYSFRNGIFYAAAITNAVQGIYHGYPVFYKEVPVPIKRKMRDDGVLSKSDYRKFL